MEKALKSRQVALFFISFMPVIKLFELPGLLAKYSGEDMWVSATLSLFLDMFTLLLILYACKNTDRDFYSLLEINFGKVIAKIIMAFYFLTFILKAILPINEQREFVELTLYETLPNPLNFFPFFAVALFLCIKKIRVLGRCADITWAVTSFGIILLIVLSIGSSDLASILPIGARGITSSLNAVYKTSNWFGDAVYMLFFMGKIKKDKRATIKIVLSYLIASVAIIIFMIVFYGIFTSIALRQPFALTKISKYATAVNNTGRFDYIGIMLIVFSQIFAISLPLYFATFCLNKICGFKNKIIPALISVGILFIITAFLHQYFKSIEGFIINYGGIFYILFCNILPALSPLLTIKEKKNALSVA